ncbi:putative membrane protein [Pseudomonas reidholzensis]|uniref:Putative membrane protein n=1 Tax=Pseudomonas reidholzensis TaxID=1785162 RepID=A0A383RQT5_9PSED|nr:hypothetical protein [Pseudomonas reidholzensis]SYX89123.1 putative membrane protein [Pseudomonas reidholzensis]
MNIQKSLSPLTLIAIFAGIVEASALASLPFLSEQSQTVYTWFLVGFPFFLTILFFLTLNFNHQTLYLPHEGGDKPEPAAGRSGHAGESSSLALSGPQANELIAAQLLRILAETHPSPRNWTLYNLDARVCIKLSVAPLGDSEGPGGF